MRGGSSSLVSVGIVDDHPLLAEGIAAVLARSKKCVVIEIGSRAEDIVGIPSRQPCDILIVDLNMPGDVFSAIAELHDNAPACRVVVFTASTETEHAVKALGAGAAGYILKGSSATELLDAVEAALRGEVYITPSFAAKVIGALNHKTAERQAQVSTKLSVREEQIVRLLLCGKQNREIARSLDLSEKTVKSYMTNLMAKLHARNRLEVVIAAQKLKPADFSSAGR
ncbi:MAG: response regulator transcription factor [Bosea sp.]|uniref:response regulator n=1 Tax=Bosea sp. (in: a-proteobacteria) TaxID=1871050 RepID=UPI001AC86F07|nr:response regulator transcription factor [Bosea sp. (in: a-proteobacteria)]MBN9451514.1 response regulator transcription factor [Bosea sp. (in: a-proteobacteria)]